MRDLGIPPRWEGDEYLWRNAVEPEPRPCVLCEREPREDGQLECEACAADVALHDRLVRERGDCGECAACREEASRWEDARIR